MYKVEDHPEEKTATKPPTKSNDDDNSAVAALVERMNGFMDSLLPHEYERILGDMLSLAQPSFIVLPSPTPTYESEIVLFANDSRFFSYWTDMSTPVRRKPKRIAQETVSFNNGVSGICDRWCICTCTAEIRTNCGRYGGNICQVLASSAASV